jgi:hypothetical protein
MYLARHPWHFSANIVSGCVTEMGTNRLGDFLKKLSRGRFGEECESNL